MESVSVATVLIGLEVDGCRLPVDTSMSTGVPVVPIGKAVEAAFVVGSIEFSNGMFVMSRTSCFSVGKTGGTGDNVVLSMTGNTVVVNSIC